VVQAALTGGIPRALTAEELEVDAELRSLRKDLLAESFERLAGRVPALRALGNGLASGEIVLDGGRAMERWKSIGGPAGQEFADRLADQPGMENVGRFSALAELLAPIVGPASASADR
jgi:hypothetical protein